MRHLKSLPFIFLLISFSSLAKSELEIEMDSYLSKKNINWKIIENGFYKQMDDWGYPINVTDKSKAYYGFLTNAESILQEISGSTEMDKIVKELNKIDDFHPVGGYSWDTPPLIWWSEVYKEGDGEDFFDREYFDYLKRRAIEGRIGAVTVCKILKHGIKPVQLADPGLQKLIISIVYPFVVPSEQNIIARNAEQQLNEVMTPIFSAELDWEKINGAFIDYIDDNYEFDTEEKLRPGEKIRFMLKNISRKNEIDKWNHLGLKEALANANIIQDGATNYSRLKELFQPIIDKAGKDLHKFHPIKSAYDIADVMIGSDRISLSVLAGGLAITFSETDLENPLYQKLFFLLFAGNLF